MLSQQEGFGRLAASSRSSQDNSQRATQTSEMPAMKASRSLVSRVITRRRMSAPPPASA